MTATATERTRKRLSHLASFGLAALLLYLALRTVDFAEVGTALADASYGWLIPLALVTLLSHVFRAWRWTLLLDELPSASGQPASRLVAFYSIMIGYMVNYVTPRLGEVVRTANLARQEARPFSSVFGTVVVGRLLDVAVLGLAILSTGFLLFDRSETVQTMLIEPIAARLPGWGWSLLIGLAIVGALVGLLVLWKLHHLTRKAASSNEPPSRLVSMLLAFQEGIISLFRTKRRGALAISTVLMWVSYLVMTHIPFLIFGLAGPYEISLVDSWCIMAIGALGILVPAPGGIGSYHYIVILTLTTLYGVPESQAAAYALLSHAGQMILYTAAGALALMIQGVPLATLREDAETITETAPSG